MIPPSLYQSIERCGTEGGAIERLPLTLKCGSLICGKGDSDAYPWQGLAVPVLITGEYENFLVGMVLPHIAPHGFGLSHPYPVTIDKHDIQIGEMIINGGSIR